MATRKILAVGLMALIGFGVLPATAAQADTVRSASATGSGRTPDLGAADAKNNATIALNSLARSLGEVCRNITATATHIYTAPDGSAYVFSATATGTCGAPPPNPYVVPRSATSQAGGSSTSAALTAGENANRSTILAAGVACTGWSSTGSLVWIAPGGVWYIYNVTTTALCTN